METWIAPGIKSWAEDERPREKLLSKGKQQLSNAELLAILIGSGKKGRTALDVARDVLQLAGHNLHELARMDGHQLSKVPGIGPARAVALMAALELSNRRIHEATPKPKKIGSSRDASEVLAPLLRDLPHEEFWVLFLSQANKVRTVQRISQGGIAGTLADLRLIFRLAIEHFATGIILCHNHPSGNLKPSQADLRLTRKIVQAGQLMDVAVLDHLIIAGDAYFSFADEGRMPSVGVVP